MDKLDAMRLFARVVEKGSFSSVAQEADVSQPTVSKQIAFLEAQLGAQLLHRTSRGLSLTDAGQTYYEAAVKVLSDLDAAESLVGRGQSRPSGLLRVSLSAGFGRLIIVPLVPGFIKSFPEVALDIIVSDRFVDLVEEGVDVAIRIGELADSSLLARRIGTSPRITVGSPAYLDRVGEPKSPQDLEHHACIAFMFQRSARAWTFNGPGESVKHHPKGPLRVNDAEYVRAAVHAGLGLAQAPRWLFARDLESGAVREILANYPSDATPVYAVTPAGGRPASKVRAFTDFLSNAFAQDPSLKLH